MPTERNLRNVVFRRRFRVDGPSGRRRPLRGALICASLLLAESAVAESSRPLSAIDWLSESVSSSSPVTPDKGRHPPVSGTTSGNSAGHGVPMDSVTVFSLDHPPADALGLVSARRAGLPPTLWGATPEARLVDAIAKEPRELLPSEEAFLMDLLLTELDPPLSTESPKRDRLFLARVDRLLEMGALEQAMALLSLADPDDPEIFRRRFDVALLLGEEDAACKVMADAPSVSPSFPARIFCLARGGDWQTAALSFETGRVLGQFPRSMDPLLARFLDPELAEDAPDLPPPEHPTPLTFRLMEAIGQPLSTATLPVAFAQADLRANNGWKARLEAAERLTRAGVLDPNQLFGLYTRDRASASGGVWDRVTLVSGLDKALDRGRLSRIEDLLPGIWDEMQEQELEPALAAMFYDRLKGLPLAPEAETVVFRLGLLTPEFETAARNRAPVGPDDPLLIGIALGDTSRAPAQDRLGLMLKQVFDAPPKTLPAAYAPLVPARLGEALLKAIKDISEGATGDRERVRNGLLLLRMTGFETTARRTALELMVLERNG